MISFLCKLAILALSLAPAHSKVASVLYSTGDASLRKDRQDENFGASRNMTVTRDDAKNSRIAVMKFKTAHMDAEEPIGALLRLYIVDADANYEERTVTIRRVHADFDEDEVSWSTFNGDSEADNKDSIEFSVHQDHVGKAGQVDVSSLMRPGEDLKLAIHVKDSGHVKFASRDHNILDFHPKLLILNSKEL